jgi:ABC-type polysaccharide/polyol phosphate transport system ATPase subunit
VQHGETILEVCGIWKRFARTSSSKRRRLLKQFNRAVAGRADDGPELLNGEFWALSDVSFSLKRGEAMGLIGLNGAGKSTLLSVIGRQLLPDRGMVRSLGRIAAMINLTAGFEDKLTGRENIYLKGALLGRSKHELYREFDQIVEFAEIGEFLHSPVGTYSSGMRMRLAFSVAIHTDPDLLLIDEVLSVGDFAFRQKCLRKLSEMRKRTAFVFVSHSFQDVARFCNRLLVLEQGKLVFDGPTQQGISTYVAHTRGLECGSDASRDDGIDELSLPTMGEFVHQPEVVDQISFEWLAEDGRSTHVVDQGRPAVAEIRFRLLADPLGVTIGIPFWNTDALMITSVNNDVAGFDLDPDADGWLRIQVRFESIDFNPGVYFPVLSITKNFEFVYRQRVAALEVRESFGMTWGVMTPKVGWSGIGDAVAITRTAGDSCER